MSFQLRLIEARKRRNLSQRVVAELSGIAGPTLSSIERGKTQPRLDSLTALCKVLNVSADSLIFGT